MKKYPFLSTLGVLLCALLFTTPAFGLKLTFKDPKKDDKGPGKYTYPTHSSYRKGDFDITKVTIRQSGSNVEIRVRVRTTIRDVWKSRSWGGNGFSVQFAQLYIHTGKGKGFSEGLPGLNVRFKKPWQRVILLSPQGKTRLKSELNLKAGKFKKHVVIPTSTRSQGKTIIAVVPSSALGGALSKSWGFQVVMQSNEGYPRKTDLLTRPVNEYGGKHRFGGGHDKDCDPHVIDILAGKAKGSGSEKKAQYKALSYKCGSKKATLPYVYAK